MESAFQIYLGRLFAHFLEIHFAAPRVEALCSSCRLFQTLAMGFEANNGYPGKGGGICSEMVDLLDLKLSIFDC